MSCFLFPPGTEVSRDTLNRLKAQGTKLMNQKAGILDRTEKKAWIAVIKFGSIYSLYAGIHIYIEGTHMQVSKENYNIMKDVHSFEKRIETMHQDFYRYYNGIEKRMPDWEGLERELLIFSKKPIFDKQLSNNLDRVLYKFQNRKKIWLKWVDEFQHRSVQGKRSIGNERKH